MEDNKKLLKKIYRKMFRMEDAGVFADFKAYDDMDDMKWEIPWSTKRFVRKRVSAVPSNGLKTVTNLFNAYSPKFDILPRGEADMETADAIETWLEWEVKQCNIKGTKEPFRQMLKSAAKKGVICAQVEYLPYWLDGEDRKIALQTGAFSINVHEPDTILYEVGKQDLRWVAIVSNVDSEFIEDQWAEFEESEDTIAYALSVIRERVEDDLEKTSRWLYIDYTDKDSRKVLVYPVEFETMTSKDIQTMWGSKDIITVLDKPNKEGFINWVISESTGDPLFKSSHKSGSWENQNFFETLSDSTILRRAYFPLLRHQSASGDPLEIDFSGEEAVIEDQPGDQTEVLNPPALDRGISELMDRNSGSMNQDLGVSGLQQTDIAGNVQFATVNAIIQLGKSVLDPHINSFEKACVLIARMMFRWVSYAGDTVTAYQLKQGKFGFKGKKINLSKDDFDWRTLNIEAELLANTPQDDMQRWNMFAGMLQTGLQIPQSEIIERMELGSPQHLMDSWLDEQIQKFSWDLFQQKKMAMMQQEIAQGAAANQPQQGAMPTEGPMPQEGMPQPAFDQTQGPGFDPSQGGSSPAEAAPMLTQTQLRGGV